VNKRIRGIKFGRIDDSNDEFHGGGDESQNPD